MSMICPPMDNGIRMLLFTKADGVWSEEEVFVHDTQEIKNLVGVGLKLTQVNLSRYMKVFYCLDNIEKLAEPQMQARVIDEDGDMQFMVSPILICQCDDTNPINLTKEIEETIKSTIDFY